MLWNVLPEEQGEKKGALTFEQICFGEFPLILLIFIFFFNCVIAACHTMSLHPGIQRISYIHNFHFKDSCSNNKTGYYYDAINYIYIYIPYIPDIPVLAIFLLNLNSFCTFGSCFCLFPVGLLYSNAIHEQL